ncbi:hypothetical protein NB689_000306 [Xanthomonas sacchari]|uniref:hypothetical protein n=1 Tax=Xanthomonas sacchari TaxID=56458 RepID=UPI00224D2B2A|nr:hypothetical protein [Xanthomonas sacchari]MCW0404922.1 hypothetical protein [Xanthomonas sacchari]MCW0414552.1 hypothetical protein [Xanthomonas sacchari]
MSSSESQGSRWKSKAWRILRTSGVAKYIVLVLFPLIGRPLHFVNGSTSKGYARARIGWAFPLAASAIWVLAMNSIFHYFSDRKFENLVEVLGANEAYRRVNFFTFLVRYETTFLIVVGIAIVAFIRWNYHRLARKALRRWFPEVPSVPFKYYLVATSSSTLIIGFGAWLLALSLRFYNGDIRPLVDGAGKGVVTGLIILYCFILYLAFENRKRSVHQIYGGMALVVDLAKIPPLVGAAFLIKFFI